MTDSHGGEPPAGPITSLTNARVKAAVRLRDRGEREATGLTIVDGARELRRALDAGVRIRSAFIAPDLLRSPDAIEVADRLRHRPGTVEASPAVLAKVAFGDRSDGVVAIVEVPSPGLDDLHLPDDPLLVVVEGVEKPGNLGAILRTADAAGVDAVIAADPLTDPFNPNAIRASLGTIFAVPLVSADSPDVTAWLARRGIRAVAAIVGAPNRHTDTDLTGRLAIVLGSEAAGLGPTWLTAAVEPVSIPMAGVADSLNVSIAAAVLLFEAIRQRGGNVDSPH
jgi:RNA methyltransferase, TrmH family